MTLPVDDGPVGGSVPDGSTDMTVEDQNSAFSGFR